MKKIILFLLLGTSFIGSSQETVVNDALRFASDDLNGTARFRAMSGSLGAIGGDLSAININPAGSIVFTYNTFSTTLSGLSQNNKTSYFGTKANENNFKLDINQIGAVLVFNNTNTTSKWNKMSLALNYENTHNFDNQILIRGTNPTNSIDGYFLNAAQNVPFDVLTNNTFSNLYFNEQQAYLGYNSYLLEYDSNSYYSNVPNGGNYYQESYISSKGYNGKLTGNFALNYDDVFSLGMNLNLHFVDINKSTSIYESNSNPEFDNGATVKRVQFENELYTYGSGFSLNLGAIAKITNQFRIGLAYESPSWYALNEQLSQQITVESTEDGSYFIETINPNIVTIYPTYKVKTPSKLTASAGYVFGNKGFINIDITSKDYSSTKFKPKNDYANLNSFMKTNLKSTLSYNIGGEYKIKQVSVRAGYRFDQSPYAATNSMSDLVGYSGGLGYSFNNARLDLSYSKSHRDYNQSIITSGMNDQAQVNNNKNSVSLSYSVTF